MTLSRLFVGVGVIVGAEADSHYVVYTGDLLYGPCDGSLSFVLWDVVGNKGCTNLQLRWVAGTSISCDAYLEFFVVKNKSVFEHDVPCFFRGKDKKCEVLVQLRFGEALELMLFSGVVVFMHEGLEDVKCMFVAQ